MHVLLVVLGWIVTALAVTRAALLVRHGLTVRAVMVVSWALLAAGVAVTATWHTPDWARWLWAIGLIFGTGAFALRHWTHEQEW